MNWGGGEEAERTAVMSFFKLLWTGPSVLLSGRHLRIPSPCSTPPPLS